MGRGAAPHRTSTGRTLTSTLGPSAARRNRATEKAASPRGRTAVPVWFAPASLEAGLPPDPARWVATLAAWITEAGTFTAVAAQHGVPLRTLMRWIAWLRAKHPELATGLPTVAAGGHWPGHEGAPRGRKKKVVTAPAD